MSNKDKAAEIYAAHISLAASDGRLFRKTVMDEIMATCGCSLAAAATFYNTAKKQAAPVDGLGRAPVPKGLRKPGGTGKVIEQLQDDNDCFTVIEVVNGCVGRCQSFLTQGDASEKFDSKIITWPTATWVMIRGLGPNTGDTFKLDDGEIEIKRHKPEVMTA